MAEEYGYGVRQQLSVAELKQRRQDLKTLIMMLDRRKDDPRMQSILKAREAEMQSLNQEITLRLLSGMGGDTDLRNSFRF